MRSTMNLFIIRRNGISIRRKAGIFAFCFQLNFKIDFETLFLRFPCTLKRELCTFQRSIAYDWSVRLLFVCVPFRLLFIVGRYCYFFKLLMRTEINKFNAKKNNKMGIAKLKQIYSYPHNTY